MAPKNIAKSFLIATATALVVRLFVVEDFRISSDSMTPNLLKGDLILVSKSAFNLRLPFSSFELFRTGKPKRSEVVAFSVPEQGTDTYVKRIVALGGDRVEIKEGSLWINGEMAEYQETPESNQILEKWPSGRSYQITKGKSQLADYGPVDVPADHFFALGDNRSDSVDSRKWGPVPYSCLKGRVALVWISVGSSGGVRPSRWLSAIQ
ncbi:MAG: signal peptidase I [Proteobacteria bacterium]|nr:signal peptidase I [Pseudomonadota bacterium]